MRLRTFGRLACAAGLLCVATGCAASAGDSRPSSPVVTFPSTQPTSAQTSAADTYVQQCARNLQSVVDADLRYAKHVSVRVGHGELYSATLLLAGAPSSIAPLPVVSGVHVPLRVQCRAGARLVAQDSGVSVGKVGDADGWRYEQFTDVAPQLTWPWTITGKDLGSQQLLLQIRPAVVSDDDSVVVSSTVLTETVTVDVTGSTVARIEHAGQSVKSHAGIVSGIIVGILAAITALLLAITKFRDAFFGLFRRAGSVPANTSADGPSESPVPSPPPQRRDH